MEGKKNWFAKNWLWLALGVVVLFALFGGGKSNFFTPFKGTKKTNGESNFGTMDDAEEMMIMTNMSTRGF